MKPALCAVLTLLTISIPALAASSSERWNVGLAVTTKQSPFLGGDTQVGVKPVIIKADGSDIRGPAWTFPQSPTHELYLGAGFDDWDAERGDSPQLQDLPELDTAVNVRAGSAWKLANGSVTAEVAQDVAAHQSTQAKLRYTHHPNSLFKLRPYVEVQWLAADIVNYYTGVAPAQARPHRPAYTADAAFALKSGARLDYAVSERLTLVAEVDATGYDSAVADSPLIAKDVVWGAAIGAAYRW